MAQLIGMVGYAQAGKDTFAGYTGWRRIAFADKLKAMALDINPRFSVKYTYPGECIDHVEYQTHHLAWIVDKYGWEYAKAEVAGVREFLQNLGLAVREHLGQDIWVEAALADWDPEVPTIVTDVRFPNEIEAIQKRGGFIIRVDREGHGPANNHVSEHAWQAYRPDYHFMFANGAFDHIRTVAKWISTKAKEGWL